MYNKLAKIGIRGKVAQFYLAVLELGESPVSEIAKQSGIGRTTAYNIMQRLQEEGLVNQVQKAGRTYVIAERPNVLIRKLEERQRLVIDALPELLSLYSGSSTKPKVHYYEAPEGVINILYDTLTCRSKQLKAIYNSEIIWLTVPGFKDIDTYARKRIAAGISLKVVRSPGKEVQFWPSSKAELREVRFANLPETSAAIMYIYDEKVAIISPRKETFGMVIESIDFARLQEALFDILWRASKPSQQAR